MKWRQRASYFATCGYLPYVQRYVTVNIKRRKEMFYLTTHSTHYIYGYMANDHLDSERGNPQPPLHVLLFSISSKLSFICTIPQTGQLIQLPLLHKSWSTGWNENVNKKCTEYVVK